MPENIDDLVIRSLFRDGKKATEISRELSTQGYDVPATQIRQFKNDLLEKKETEVRLEYGRERLMESIERANIEFEDILLKLKKWMEEFDAEGNPVQGLSVVDRMLKAIEMGLKVQGRLNEKALQIKTNNINVIDSSNFIESFRKLRTSWFDTMGVRVDGGKVIFDNPSPEFLDDVYKWEASKARIINADVVGDGNGEQ